MVVHPNIQWGNKVIGLWLNLFVPQKPLMPRLSNTLPSTSAGSNKKGICFSFNSTQYKWPNCCKFRHECAFCLGPHPVSKFLKKSSINTHQLGKNSFLKSHQPSDFGKHGAVVASVSRPIDCSINLNLVVPAVHS